MLRKIIRNVLALPKRLGQRRSSLHALPLPQHGINRARLSHGALRVTNRLQEAGYSAFIVGGAVRDLILGLSPKDYDVVTNATPEQIRHLFRRSRIIGRRFRIVHVLVGNETIEVTTFRGGKVENTSETGRIMADNNFGSQEEDAYRRDFTINALLYDPSTETVIDYHRGVADLRAKRLVMIGPPARRYQEDPVRMLRAIRLAAKLGLDIDPATQKPIADYAHLLKKEPPARLFDETLKLLMSGHAYRCLQKLQEEGLVKGIFPLLDMVMDKQYDQTFLQHALSNTDKRIQLDRPVSVGFLLASLLWHQVKTHWEQHLANQEKPVLALLNAIDDVALRHDKDFAIPKRFGATMREIWKMQTRFDNRSGQRPYRLLEQSYFRAAYDFLVLRSEVGEVDPALVAWWTRFQNSDEEECERLIKEAKANNPDAPAKKRKRRSKSHTSNHDKPMESNHQDEVN